VLVPVATWLAEHHGPAAGLLALAAIDAAALGVGAAVVASRTRVAGPVVPRAVAAPGTARWYVSSAAMSAAVFVPFAHLAEYCSAHGWGLSFAAAMVSVMSVASLAGRLVFAAAALRIGSTAALRASALGVGSALVWWLVSGPQPVAVTGFAVAFGMCHGGYVAMLPAALAERYGPVGLGGRFGALYTATAVGALLGPGVAGAATAWTGSPQAAIALATGAAFGGCAVLRGVAQTPRQATSPSGA
jgi:MFS transporter, OFA family, oxalate/formate antiporter